MLIKNLAQMESETDANMNRLVSQELKKLSDQI